MQALPLVTADMPATGATSGSSTSSAHSGQDGLFAAHLVKASGKQPTADRQANPVAHRTEASKGQESTKGTPVPDKAVANKSSRAKTAHGKSGQGQSSQDKTTQGKEDVAKETTTKGDEDSVASRVQDSKSKKNAAALGQTPFLFQWAAVAVQQNTASITVSTLKNGTSVDRLLGAISSGQVESSMTQLSIQAQQTAASGKFNFGQMTQESTGGNAAAVLPDTGDLSQTPTVLTPEAPLSAGSVDALPTDSIEVNALKTHPASLLTGKEGTATTVAIHSDTKTAQPLQQGAVPVNVAQQDLGQAVQNDYSQSISIQQSSQSDEAVANTVPNPDKNSAATTINGGRQDINTNYIHSNLPANATMATNDESGRNKNSADTNQQNNSGILEKMLEHARADQLQEHKLQTTDNLENQPFLFAHQREALSLGSMTTTTSTAGTSADSSMTRLPSGIVVPDNTVIDQMITHFNVNKPLESGAVNLKLHPQELGELRLEIKVEQDNIKAHIIAQSPHAQEMINQHIPRLRETLQQQGLNLQHVEVTLAAHDHAGDQQYQGNTRHDQLGRSFHNKSTASAFNLDPVEAASGMETMLSNLSVLA